MTDLLAEHFDFNIVVYRFRCRTGRIAAHVARLCHPSVNRTAVIALTILLVGTFTELRGIVVIVIEDGCHAR